MTRTLILLALAGAAPLAAAPAADVKTPTVVEPLYAPGGKIPQPRPFADVPRSHWAYGAVEYLRQLGLIEGYPGEPPRFNAPEEKPAGAPGRKAGVRGK